MNLTGGVLSLLATDSEIFIRKLLVISESISNSAPLVIFMVYSSALEYVNEKNISFIHIRMISSKNIRCVLSSLEGMIISLPISSDGNKRLNLLPKIISYKLKLLLINAICSGDLNSLFS